MWQDRSLQLPYILHADVSSAPLFLKQLLEKHVWVNTSRFIEFVRLQPPGKSICHFASVPNC